MSDPYHGKVNLSDSSVTGVTVDAWAYRNAKSADVYMKIKLHGFHLVTASVRVPYLKPRVEKGAGRKP